MYFKVKKINEICEMRIFELRKGTCKLTQAYDLFAFQQTY